jgi:diguanylate cyclase (GGDEF)-like protein/PAS domain S-box-containing protein
MPRPLARSLRKVQDVLPAGSVLPDEVWEARHRWIGGLLWAHAPAVFVFALARGHRVGDAALQGLIVTVFAVMPHLLRPHRRAITVMTSVGLLTCSALLVRLSSGAIEMHFHYFVMVGIITLYQDWWPFLIAIGYVVLQHGLAGAIDPAAVYNHESAVEHPWRWASIHGLFILGMSSAGVASWRLNESFLAGVAERQIQLEEAQQVGRLGGWERNRLTGRTVWSAEMYRILGLDPSVVAAAPESFFAQVHAEDRAAAVSGLSATWERGEPYEADLRIDCPDGVRWVLCRARATASNDGVPIIVAGTIHDITERKELEHQLTYRASHDALTGLANQALFRDEVGQALVRAAASPTRVTVLILDVDNFKGVNDSLGHTAGDALLVALAERLRRCIRPVDTAARLGGDEFAILVEDAVGGKEADDTAQRIVSALRQPFDTSDRVVVVTASIGVAGGDAADDADQLLRNADLAMYTAKRDRRGGVETYRASMHLKALYRLEMEADLRRALTTGQLRVHYQPIFTLDDMRMVGVEALVRWEHPRLGLLGPAAFVPLAEECGLIADLGRQVLDEACRQTREWQVTYPAAADMRVSVNVSSDQLNGDAVVGQVATALLASGLPTRSLVLELTETAMMRDTEATVRTLTKLKEIGLRLAIDDFGTGYSSLSYLQSFPVDVLKIDRAFVSSMEPAATDGRRPSLAGAIVSLAQALGLDTVAEGIETVAEAEALRDLGCHHGQGYLFSRPVPPEGIDALILGGACSADGHLRRSVAG